MNTKTIAAQIAFKDGMRRVSLPITAKMTAGAFLQLHEEKREEMLFEALGDEILANRPKTARFDVSGFVLFARNGQQSHMFQMTDMIEQVPDKFFDEKGVLNVTVERRSCVLADTCTKTLNTWIKKVAPVDEGFLWLDCSDAMSWFANVGGSMPVSVDADDGKAIMKYWKTQTPFTCLDDLPPLNTTNAIAVNIFCTNAVAGKISAGMEGKQTFRVSPPISWDGKSNSFLLILNEATPEMKDELAQAYAIGHKAHCNAALKMLAEQNGWQNEKWAGDIAGPKKKQAQQDVGDNDEYDRDIDVKDYDDIWKAFSAYHGKACNDPTGYHEYALDCEDFLALFEHFDVPFNLKNRVVTIDDTRRLVFVRRETDSELDVTLDFLRYIPEHSPLAEMILPQGYFKLGSKAKEWVGVVVTMSDKDANSLKRRLEEGPCTTKTHNENIVFVVDLFVKEHFHHMEPVFAAMPDRNAFVRKYDTNNEWPVDRDDDDDDDNVLDMNDLESEEQAPPLPRDTFRQRMAEKSVRAMAYQEERRRQQEEEEALAMLAARGKAKEAEAKHACMLAAKRPRPEHAAPTEEEKERERVLLEKHARMLAAKRPRPHHSPMPCIDEDPYAEDNDDEEEDIFVENKRSRPCSPLTGEEIEEILL